MSNYYLKKLLHQALQCIAIDMLYMFVMYVEHVYITWKYNSGVLTTVFAKTFGDYSHVLWRERKKNFCDPPNIYLFKVNKINSKKGAKNVQS